MKTNLRSLFAKHFIPGLPLLALGVALPWLGACSMAARPIPPATSHDERLEAEAIRAFPGLKDFTGSTPSGTPIQARIVSGWDVEQNEYTGVATKRYVDIVVAVKEDDGTCTWTKGRFSQQHMGGGSYGELHPELQLERGGIECNSLESDGANDGANAKETAAKPAGASDRAAFAVVAVGSEPAPAETDAEYAAKVETIVQGLGADAVDECKAYIREACMRQKGSTRLTVCRTYADSIKPTASSTQGAIVCKAATDALPK